MTSIAPTRTTRSNLRAWTADPVLRAIAAIAEGRPVVVVDDADRENEGDLIFAAEFATPELLAFTVRHTSGFVCVALPEEECDRLRLPPMAARGGDQSGDRFGTAYCVTVDLAGTGTGISATSRAATIAALAAPESVASDFRRPGHVVPLRARAGGVLRRRGHTEAAVDLTRLAGLAPAGALCEITSVDRPGEMARGDELVRFAATHGLELITVAELVAHRLRTEQHLRRGAETTLPTVHGTFRALGYKSVVDGSEHIALLAGSVGDGADVPLYVHVECLTGDVLGSTACACGHELDRALDDVATGGRGLVVYVRSGGACRAFALPGRPAQVSGTGPGEIAAAIARGLGIFSVHLHDDRDGIAAALRDSGIDVGARRPWRAAVREVS